MFFNFYMKKLNYGPETLQNLKLINQILANNFSNK